MTDLLRDRLILPNELKRLKALKEKTPRNDPKDTHENSWVPILWACNLIERSRTGGKIEIPPPVFANLISSLDYITTNNRKILNYGWINFPVKYTQVASISVFLYFLAALFGRQFLVPPEDLQDQTFNASTFNTGKAPYSDHSPDFIFPFFTIVELLCYVASELKYQGEALELKNGLRFDLQGSLKAIMTLIFFQNLEVVRSFRM